jgi:hypothetical protein
MSEVPLYAMAPFEMWCRAHPPLCPLVQLHSVVLHARFSAEALFLIHSLSLSCSLDLSISCSLSLALARSLSLALPLSRSLALVLSLSRSHLSLYLSLLLSRSHAHALSPSLSLSLQVSILEQRILKISTDCVQASPAPQLTGQCRAYVSSEHGTYEHTRQTRPDSGLGSWFRDWVGVQGSASRRVSHL